MLTPELLCETDPKQASEASRLQDWLSAFANVCIANLAKLNLQNDLDQVYTTTCLNVRAADPDAANHLPGGQGQAL